MSHETPSNSEMHLCDHRSCCEPKRLEYCEVEASDPNSDAGQNVLMIDHLMYERGDFDSCVEYTNDGRMRYISREFSFLSEESRVYARPLIESSIRILHIHDTKLKSDEYQVKYGWRVHQDDAAGSLYETIYTLEQWPNVIHSTIEEFNLSTEQVKSGDTPRHERRSMTGYDHAILYDHLRDLDEMRIAQERISIAESI